MRRWAALALLLTLAVGACGSDDKSDAEQVREAVEGFYTGTDPKVCTENATRAFVVKIFGGAEQGALARCRDARSDVQPGTVRVGRVSVRGEQATVAAKYPGRDVELELRKQGDAWKLTDATNLGQDPLAARAEIAKCLEGRGLTVAGPKDRNFSGRRVPTVFTETPSGNGMGILIYPMGKGGDFVKDIKALLNRESKPEVNVVRSRRGPRVIVFERKSSASEKQLAEACLPETEPGG